MTRLTRGLLRRLNAGTGAQTRSKLGNRASNGFASKLEERRFMALSLWQSSGYITDLKRQVAFVVSPDGCDRIRYTVDFTYRLLKPMWTGDTIGQLVAEELKGEMRYRTVKGERVLVPTMQADASVRMRLFCWKFPEYDLRIIRQERSMTRTEPWSMLRFADRRKRKKVA